MDKKTKDKSAEISPSEMTAVVGGARFSRCRRFRYALTRTWDLGETVLFVGLNPSTADARNDDPTVRRCIGFARSWGYARLVLVNLFAYRSTSPSMLRKVADPIGPSNDRIIRELVTEAALIVAAWGNHGGFRNRGAAVLPLLLNPHCFGKTGRGQPLHPLYLPATLTPVPYTYL